MILRANGKAGVLGWFGLLLSRKKWDVSQKYEKKSNVSKIHNYILDYFYFIHLFLNDLDYGNLSEIAFLERPYWYSVNNATLCTIT